MTNVPANAKKPADHKAKAETGPDRTIKVRGVEFTVAADALDDFELLDDLSVMQEEEDGTRLPLILRRLLGDQRKKAMDAIRGESGRVSVEDAAEFVGELLGELDPNS